MSILQANGLVKIYGRRSVVDGVSLQVDRGEIVGILGPNGAGKTTTFRMICGLTRPDHGDVLLRDVDVTKWPMYIRAKQGGMGYLPQQSSVFAKLSAEDNLRGIMQLLGFNRQRQKLRVEELLDQFKIAHVRRTLAGRLSGGERRRLEIARCLISEPEIIMLDEPFAGIDPITVQNIQVIIRELATKGISILITDHAAREILQITDRTYVVDEGKILVSGTADQIVRHPEVKRKYLGDVDVGPTVAPRQTIRIKPETVEASMQLNPSASPVQSPVPKPKMGASPLTPSRRVSDL
jgi:lipopolysaccharide export system ATP-binding protein